MVYIRNSEALHSGEKEGNGRGLCLLQLTNQYQAIVRELNVVWGQIHD